MTPFNIEGRVAGRRAGWLAVGIVIDDLRGEGVARRAGLPRSERAWRALARSALYSERDARQHGLAPRTRSRAVRAAYEAGVREGIRARVLRVQIAQAAARARWA